MMIWVARIKFVCSTFVLMVAKPAPLLSDQPSELPQRTGFGGRFHYFCGASGRSYIFTRVDAEELADFKGAVAVTAAPIASGRLAIRAISLLEQHDQCPHPAAGHRSVSLVHLLAADHAARRALVEDLAGTHLPDAAALRSRLQAGASAIPDRGRAPPIRADAGPC
ncbi:MAG: hypothetical protein ACTSU0_02365 [Alphaproteobacteria bacterium]